MKIKRIIAQRLLHPATVLATALLLPTHASAQFTELPKEDPELDSREQRIAPTAFADDVPTPILDWGIGDGKNFLIPALEIVGFDTLLNLADRVIFEGTDEEDNFKANFSTFIDNVKGSWVYDEDPFAINQFGHPYQGSMYHGFARSAGLDYWPSAGYTFLGSLFWELAGETTPPSINDQFTTGIGGSFLGEPLFRLASLFLESGNTSRPGFWRELGAAAISPATGFNRWAFDDRFDGVFRSHNPAVYTHFSIGVNVDSNVDSDVNVSRNSESEDITPQSYRTGEVVGDLTVAYGLPGKIGYAYQRPFDYFHFQLTAASSNILENVISRGLLYGKQYRVGENYRGIWGLYGNYDYIAPQIFRISSTGLSVGTTGQLWLSPKFAVQGTVLGGVGYGSAGTIDGPEDRDYHNGVTGFGLLDSRFIYDDWLSFSVSARDYFVSDIASDEDNGEENISRIEAALTFRVFNLHGITIKYITSRRDANYSDLPNSDQQVGALSIGYAFLGQTRSGAVDWRPKSKGGPYQDY